MHHGNQSFLLALTLTATLVSATHAQTTMAYRFKEGDKLHYAMEQKTKSTMSLAGTDIIITYHAPYAAKLLQQRR